MSNEVVKMCPEFKEGFGFCEKKQAHEGKHKFPPFTIKCNNCGVGISWQAAWRERGPCALVCGEECYKEIQRKYASEIVRVNEPVS